METFLYYFILIKRKNENSIMGKSFITVLKKRDTAIYKIKWGFSKLAKKI